MANFTTHIAVGTIASGALATLTLAADVVAPENLIAVTVAGVLGSVLPDIDLKESRPSRAMFSGLAAFFSFAALFLFAEHLSIAELWLLALAVFLFVRYAAHAIFHRMSYHRGIYHSLIAALFFGLLTTVIYKSVLGRPAGVAWLAGAFMLVGYLVHLTLDEIYSVDVMDTRIKSSFGTALKPVDFKHPGHSAAMACAVVVAFVLAPPSTEFFQTVSSKVLWADLEKRLLPRGGWFHSIGEIAREHELRHLPRRAVDQNGAGPADTGDDAGGETHAAPLTTGTVPVTPQR